MVAGVGALSWASVSIPLDANTLFRATLTWYQALKDLWTITAPAFSHPLAAWWPCGAQGKVVRIRPSGGNLDLVAATDTFYDCSGKEGNQEARHGMW